MKIEDLLDQYKEKHVKKHLDKRYILLIFFKVDLLPINCTHFIVCVRYSLLPQLSSTIKIYN